MWRAPDRVGGKRLFSGSQVRSEISRARVNVSTREHSGLHEGTDRSRRTATMTATMTCYGAIQTSAIVHPRSDKPVIRCATVGDVDKSTRSSRRAAMLSLGVACAAFVAGSTAVIAAPNTTNQPVDPKDSPLVQELLRRTEEKREERYKERLDDYNRRNFSDYFDVVDKGYNGKTATENDAAIREQLERWKGK